MSRPKSLTTAALDADTTGVDRRTFLSRTAVVAGATWLGGPSAITRALATAPDVGPYGPLGTVNADGLQLPAGFSSRLLAVSGQVVPGTSYTWHGSPDGGACTMRDGGGWLYVSNGEAAGGNGGVGVLAFDADGTIADAYPILSGTTRSCSGGITPWGSYLSGEENGATGRVFECDPQRRSQGVHRPLLGAFAHEMIAVDPMTGDVFMVEDDPQGRLYRFRPHVPGDLSAGALTAAALSNGRVSWVPVATTAPARATTTTPFAGAEGAWVMNGSLYLTTKLDVRVWRLELRTMQLSVFYDFRATPGSSLEAVDNLVGHQPSGDLFVAEDGGNLEVGLLTTVGPATVSPFLRFVGHDTSEVSGIAFSPDGSRLYVGSQRGTDGVTGRTYEVRGPFRRQARVDVRSPRRFHRAQALRARRTTY